MIDHLIISEEKYTSFADKGIIKELQHSGAFEIVDKEKRAIEEWRIKTEKERAVKIEIARKMINDGIEIDIVKKYTSLSKSEIKSL